MPRKTLIPWTLGLVLLTGVSGCEPDEEKQGGAAAEGTPPRASVTLRVAVVSDQPLRRAIDRLRGEWNALTDGQIETSDVASDADLVAVAADADLIVFPSRALGVLCEAKALRSVRSSVLEAETLRFSDFLPLVRDQEVVYAREVMALPVGCPTPLLLAAGEAAPESIATPEDETRLALAYLAWAAPHAVHRSRTATLFDADTFVPRLREPPFERALELMVEAAGDGPARWAWPQRDTPIEPGLTPRAAPAAEEVYNQFSEQWESSPPGDRRATLVASSGRLVGVTVGSRNAATAFRYAAWLVGPDNARVVATASDRVANCRGSFARSGDWWFASDDRDLARAFAETNAEALRTPRYLLAPRLPGAEEYLAALGARVRDALEGEPAAEALAQAADDWEAISRARGRETQRAAYGRSINATRFFD